MKGYSADSPLENISVKEANKQENDIEELSGQKITLRRAVEQSLNGCAYSLYNEIGTSYGLSFVKNMNFDGIAPSDYNSLSPSLGGLTYGTNTEQMASAYYALFNHGMFVEPTCIVSIQDKFGVSVYSPPKSKMVYYDKAAAIMTDVMKGVVTNGTAKNMKWNMSIEAAGKTGTTNDNKDGWFCGYTPYYTMSVWIGYDSPQAVSDLAGNTYPVQLWKAAMTALTEGMPPAALDTSAMLNQDKIYMTDEEKRQKQEAERNAEMLKEQQAKEAEYNKHQDIDVDAATVAEIYQWISKMQNATKVSDVTKEQKNAEALLANVQNEKKRNDLTEAIQTVAKAKVQQLKEKDNALDEFEEEAERQGNKKAQTQWDRNDITIP